MSEEQGHLLFSDGHKEPLEAGLQCLETIGDNLFQYGGADYRSTLVEVCIPESVQVISDRCFAGCDGLKKVSFAGASDLLMIGHYAFDGCKSLSEFPFPSHLRYIGSCAFAESGLESVDLEDADAICIGFAAFYHCNHLLKVTLSISIETIPDSCFEDCHNLVKVKAIGSIKIVQQKAFKMCEDLSKIEGFDCCRYIEPDGNEALLELLS